MMGGSPPGLGTVPGHPIGLRVGTPGRAPGTDSKTLATGCRVAEVEANLGLDRR